MHLISGLMLPPGASGTSTSSLVGSLRKVFFIELKSLLVDPIFPFQTDCSHRVSESGHTIDFDRRITSIKTLYFCLLVMAAGFVGSAHAATCDVDQDGDVDREDVKLIVLARDTRAASSNDLRDMDSDGRITMLDARACIKRCGLPNCKVVKPGPSVEIDNTSQTQSRKPATTGSTAENATRSNSTSSTQQNLSIRRKPASSDNTWEVKRGDTLYAIGRAVFPDSGSQQARLRQDIVELNPSIFANGANNLDVGVILQLPDYVTEKDETSVSTQAGVQKPPAAAIDPPAPTAIDYPPAPPAADDTPAPPVAGDTSAGQSSIETATVTNPRPVTAPVPTPSTDQTTQTETALERKANKSSAEFRTQSRGSFFTNLGFSFGGDRLIETDSGFDFFAGSGGHARLGYETLANRRSGYRVALGLQYSPSFDSGTDASISGNYLQVAYQYRANEFLYGIGLVAQSGLSVKNDVDGDTDYDAGGGVVFYLENIDRPPLAGWGASYTAIELDESDSNETADASRAEVYYSWRF